MAKVTFIFKNLKVVLNDENELKDYESFLRSVDVDKLAEAYEIASKDYKFA